jgi:hypothetical protein
MISAVRNSSITIDGTIYDDFYVAADMKKIYICSPLRGDTKKNIRNARHYCE